MKRGTDDTRRMFEMQSIDIQQYVTYTSAYS